MLGQAIGRGQPGRAARARPRAATASAACQRAGLGRASATTRPTPTSGPACRSATRSRRSASSRRAWRCSTPASSSASRTSAAPGSPAPPARPPSRAAWAWTSTSRAVPRREPGMEPFEVMTSESQERMLAIVEPERPRRGAGHLRPVGGRAPTVVGHGHRRAGGCASSTASTARCWPTCPAASLHDAAPLYDRPAGRARRPRARPADDADAALRRPPTAGADLLDLLDDTSWVWSPVRPPAVPQHGRGPGRRRHRAAAQAPDHRRRHRPGPGPHHRRQPPLVRRRPPAGHGAASWPSRCSTWPASAPGRWRSSTASTSATPSTPR